jgi:hypothetical protein
MAFAFTICANSQQKQDSLPQTAKDTVHYIYDTTARTLCFFVSDLNNGNSMTGYLLRVVKSKMDYVQPTEQELKNDSFVVKKKKVPVQVDYYAPVNAIGTDPKTGKKQEPRTVYVKVPSQVILQDFNGNFDYLIPKDSTINYNNSTPKGKPKK